MAEQSILTDSLIPSNSQNDINVPFLYNDTPFDWTPRNPFLEESDSGSGSGPFCKVYQDTESHTNVFLSTSSCIKEIFAFGLL
jgi:hypothetical protein